jgi:hypothetical protein
MLDSPAEQNQGITPEPTQDLTNFVATATPEISVAALLARVQEEVARHRQAASQNPSNQLPASFPGTGRRSRSSLDWGLVTTNLHIAEKNALVGRHVPKMKRFPGPIRVAARVLAAGLLYPLRIITNPQREFNQATMIALQALRDGVQQLEKANQQALADLEKRHLNEIKTALGDQERRLVLFLDEARPKAS